MGRLNLPNVIFDLDGTLANAEHRLHHIKNGSRDWDLFFEACVDDTPIDNNIELCQSLYENYNVIILTGRSNVVWDKTVTWLREHDIAYDELLMRQNGDYTPDHELKILMAQKANLTPKNTLCVFEDRSSVVRAWRNAGFVCHQVTEGEF